MNPPLTVRHAEAEAEALLARLRGRRPLFVLVIANTETARIPGISAAGARPDLVPFTAAADAEVLAYGAARCIAGVPSNPLGPPGPSLITRAALELADIPHLVVDAGAGVAPDVPCIRLGDAPGGPISSGAAVPDAARLFARAHEMGRELALAHEYVVIGESVPGGTTTALALLLALGIAAEGRVSSSLAENAHALKGQIARQALAHLPAPPGRVPPLQAAATLGDPMQPVVAGLAAGLASQDCPLLLAGGTQMIAVLALLQRLDSAPLPSLIAVATTRWVADDPTADAAGLMAELGRVPLLASTLSFAGARHEPLRRYEDYLVKEGVGAGGAAIAAGLAAGVSPDALAARVEQLYDRVLQGASACG